MDCREFDPVEVAYAVAQYLPADPAVWVEQCALAGVMLSTDAFGLYQMYNECTDGAQAKFLSSWLNLTPGGTEAVIEYLKRQWRTENGEPKATGASAALKPPHWMGNFPRSRSPILQRKISIAVRDVLGGRRT
jgi:hypothetical protein